VREECVWWRDEEFVQLRVWTLVVVSREMNFSKTHTLDEGLLQVRVCDEKDHKRSSGMMRVVETLSLYEREGDDTLSSFHTDTNKHLTDKATLSLYDTHL